MIKSIAELNQARDECKSMVTKRSLASAAAAAVPVPAADVGVDLLILNELIPAINRRFGLAADQIEGLDPQVKQRITVIATSLGSSFIGKAVTKEAVTLVLKKVGVRVATKSVAKYIPILGTAVASSVSFGAMKWMGNSHVDDCYEAVRQLLAADTSDAVGSIADANSEEVPKVA
ncbi:hypothetical protein [Sphingomonas glaciei]|uniref:DUF697 domain-containing protein n=1 Tax=Sphingomonas glaciei TaxID=2938948 RepID=A0ABY5MWN8_9SPHN|nr:hypothetical protein [Sphingomonas glaciei]UUR07548.1 hypothetical protein M1K48_11470 [Sphingomonas glaciei]